MIKIKNMAMTIGLLSLLSTTANATSCAVATSCEGLGYKQQTCDDGIKCPFNLAYAYCPPQAEPEPEPEPEPENGIEDGLCYKYGVLIGVQVGNSNLCVALENASTSASWDEAMAACANNGWRLPSCTSEIEDSNCELYAVYQNINTINSKLRSNGGTQLINVYYWSSTEGPSAGAYLIDMDNGDVGTGFKSYSISVRCVRDF